MGRPKISWTKEMDDKLLAEISKGRTLLQLTIEMDMCVVKIKDRIKAMGFEGLIDARNVMRG